MRSPQAPLHAPRATSDVDTQGLARLGYEQELHRGVGSFSSFAAGFSFVSILTTVFQLFGLGFENRQLPRSSGRGRSSSVASCSSR